MSSRGPARLNCITQAWSYLNTILNSQEGLKVLLCDEALLSIVSIVYSQHELLMHGVVLVDLLSNTSRFQMKHFSCVVLCRPCKASFLQLFQELAEGNFSSYTLHFTTMLNSKLLPPIAEADVLNLVRHVGEIYLDSVPITEWVCISQLNETLDHPISLQSPPYNPLAVSQWSEDNVSRFSDSIVSFFLSTNRRPVIRYRGNSPVIERLVEGLSVRLNTVHGIFPDVPAKDTVLLLLDRMDDPITPLLLPWTYEAMIHELIGFQRGNEVMVDVSSGRPESPTPTLGEAEDSRHVLTPYTDSFFKNHRYHDWGQVCLAISEMVKAYKEMNQHFDRETVSFEEIKNFMSEFPEAKKKSAMVTRHCSIASEMLAEIQGRGLTKLSILEQDIVANNSVSEHTQQVLEKVQDPKTDIDDALRLALLYCLRYEKATENGVSQIRQALQNRRCLPDKLEVFDRLLELGGEGYRLHQLFKPPTGHLFKSVAKAVGQFGKEVQNVLTGHTPLLRKIVNRAYNGTLDTNRYPVLDVPGSPIPHAQAPNVKGKDIIVVMVGGVTYSEAMLLSRLNDELIDNNTETLMTLGKTVTKKFGGEVEGNASSPAESGGLAETSSKIQARVSLLSTSFINSKEFIRSLSQTI